MSVIFRATATVVVFASMLAAQADDWPHWRGPHHNGISHETGLPDSFNLETGENVLWVNEDFGGRAAPIVMGGRLYLNCRTLDDINDPEQKIHAQQQVICLDANTGELIWQDVFNIAQTDIPAPRVGWASLAGDEETGNVYLHSVDGLFRCYDRDGKVLWEHQLFEEYGKISGYGGRTQTPLVDEDRVIVNFLEINWGKEGAPPPDCSYYAFDKKTGELLWKSAQGGRPLDTTYSNAFIDVLDGTRMLIGGNADGGVYAMQARTGKPIWGHVMSKRGLNMTPVSDGKTVYMSHGEDNTDNVKFGSIRAVDGSSQGEVPAENVKWRVDDIKAGYSALLVVDGVLYVTTDTAKLVALDAETGKELWIYSVGTVGKGAPVYADGKIYVMEVNGIVSIIRPTREKAEELCRVTLPGRGGKGADEIYGSPAVADGKVFLVTRDRIVCLGKPGAEKKTSSPSPVSFGEEKPVVNEVKQVKLTPFEVILAPGQSQKYQVRLFDENGGFIENRPAQNIKLGEGIKGVTIEGDTLTVDADLKEAVAGYFTVEVDGIEAEARLRAFPKLPWTFDFNDLAEREVPPTWVAAKGKLLPTELEGIDGKAMKNVAAAGRPSTYIWLGPPSMAGYTFQSDVMAKEDKARRLPNVGITVQKYNLILKGNTQKLQVVDWAPHLRMAKEERFRWDPEVWYTMKLRVDVDEKGAHVRGKVWKKGTDEPEAWTIEQFDPHPNREGSPGLYIYALGDTESYYDNMVISATEGQAQVAVDATEAAEKRQAEAERFAREREEAAEQRATNPSEAPRDAADPPASARP